MLYDVIYGHNQWKLSKQITSMTLGELIDAQASFTNRFKSSASGRYQFMRATLQDRLGYHLLIHRGYNELIAGKISRTELGKRLAQEWALFPVLAATKGAHRDPTRG